MIGTVLASACGVALLAAVAAAGAGRGLRRLRPARGSRGSRERRVRRYLGMPRCHPESITRPSSRAERRLLDALQADAWPGDEWAACIAEAWEEDW